MPYRSGRAGRRKALFFFSRRSERILLATKSRVGVWLQKHGVRILLVIVLALAIRLLFPLATTPEFPEFEVGMVAPRDVISPISCNLFKNPEQLAAERAEQVKGIFPVIEFIPDLLDSTNGKMDRFFTQLDRGIRQPGPEGSQAGRAGSGRSSEILPHTEAELAAWLTGLGIDVDRQGIAYLMREERRTFLREKLKTFISSHLEKGILSDDSRRKIHQEFVTVIRDGEEKVTSPDQLKTLSQAFQEALKLDIDPRDREISQSLFLALITHFLKPNLIYDEIETSRRIQQAEAQVSPIKGQVLEGEKIIEKGYRIKEDALLKYHALKEEILAREPGLSAYNAFISFLGSFLINAFLLLIFGLYLYFYRKPLYDALPTILSLSVIFLLVMAPAAVIARVNILPAEFFPILVPISLASLLIAILYDVRIAVVATLVLSIMIGGQESFGYDVLFISLIGGVSGGLSIRVLRKRRQLGESILFIMAGYFLATLSIDMIRLAPWQETAMTWLGGAINATTSTLVAMALLPVFEYVFNETTDITLMELSDFNHPLLKSLVIRAPGTWAHTLAVSNLAESAAEAVGANSLLTRVGCYYHDAGKIKKPEYFIENQTPGVNPHDHCSPAMSAMIIESHVKEGIELAREAKLPQRIVDFIPEHHGTTSISFFYEKAKELNNDTSISIHDFSYQGPKPRSKETAICMLADTVESMSRSLVDPSPSRIRGMVREAVRTKIDTDQLEECDLTFKEIHRIEEAFVKILLARFHSRIDYIREEEEDEEKDNAEKDSTAHRPSQHDPADHSPEAV
ncbi:MAG: hypothetical protein A2Z06_02995 [Candidatus Glassbacteria bacterium RBG_16_58_8]|uniref:HD/PDEase domain-containing protein n=1 Tax=Candidatus Glassbacteria bacterium RBG_16_58_8 TaxID=1817866 RepID=A0A1F5YC61_9BACT|nr:MAG: hypothetical protein A2Z06_02995 [Candidatus Glassbacteria bacterium RBG_16_58_8]